ncbi:hypothetical protein [Spirillospora sp. NPDC048819]|uniref:hypothetical protein n=1 Tax=Spirillospora sp. NPDC048819 TaxID=3155268 RepID=UPI0033EBAA8C
MQTTKTDRGRNRVAAAATATAAKGAEEVSRLRGGRSLHRVGRSYTGTLRVPAGAPAGAGPLSEPGEHEVIARLSKSTGLPGGLPDILGVALRVRHGAQAVDLLFASTGMLPLARHVLRPRRGFLPGPYTTLLPYGVGGRTRVLGLFPAGRRRLPADVGRLDAAVAAEPLAFTLAAAAPLGRWAPVAVLGVHTPLREDDPAVTAFDPVLNALPGLRPVGPFMRLRRLAYAGSRTGRGAPEPSGDWPGA